jgi:hypothetical protein
MPYAGWDIGNSCTDRGLRELVAQAMPFSESLASAAFPAEVWIV